MAKSEYYTYLAYVQVYARVLTAAVVRVYDAQFGDPDRTLERVNLTYRLQDAGEGSTKMQRLRRSLPIGGIIDTGRVWVRLRQQVEYQAWTPMCIRHHRDVVELQPLPKQSYDSRGGTRL